MTQDTQRTQDVTLYAVTQSTPGYMPDGEADVVVGLAAMREEVRAHVQGALDSERDAVATLDAALAAEALRNVEVLTALEPLAGAIGPEGDTLYWPTVESPGLGRCVMARPMTAEDAAGMGEALPDEARYALWSPESALLALRASDALPGLALEADTPGAYVVRIPVSSSGEDYILVTGSEMDGECGWSVGIYSAASDGEIVPERPRTAAALRLLVTRTLLDERDRVRTASLALRIVEQRERQERNAQVARVRDSIARLQESALEVDRMLSDGPPADVIEADEDYAQTLSSILALRISERVAASYIDPEEIGGPTDADLGRCPHGALAGFCTHADCTPER